MTKGKYGYKLDQLAKMLDAETGANGGYGIYVSCQWANVKSIIIDANAVIALIAHYKERNEKEVDE